MTNILNLLRKASEMDLTTGLFGRTLSQEEIEKAERNFVEGENSDFERRYYTQGDEFVVEETFKRHNTIPDSSRGWKKPREGYMPHTRIKSTYNSEGQLRERKTSDLRLYTNAIVTFSPPGRIIGKRTIDK